MNIFSGTENEWTDQVPNNISGVVWTIFWLTVRFGCSLLFQSYEFIQSKVWVFPLSSLCLCPPLISCAVFWEPRIFISGSHSNANLRGSASLDYFYSDWSFFQICCFLLPLSLTEVARKSNLRQSGGEHLGTAECCSFWHLWLEYYAISFVTLEPFIYVPFNIAPSCKNKSLVSKTLALCGPKFLLQEYFQYFNCFWVTNKDNLVSIYIPTLMNMFILWIHKPTE